MFDNEEILYTETKNYKFRKDSPDNYYDIGVVNDNLDKIDKTIKDVKDENTNVQSDWNIADTKSDAFIKNKPTSLPANGGTADTIKNTLPINKGGTGATSVVNALKNLNLLNNNLNSTPSCSALTYRNYTDFGLESMRMFSFAALLADYSTIIFSTSKYEKAHIIDAPTDEGFIIFTRGGLNHRAALFFSTANNNRGVVYQWSSNSQILLQNWTKINDGGNADTVDGKHAEDFAPNGYGLGTHCKYVTGNWNDYTETGFYSGNNLINQPWQITSGSLYCYMFVIKHDSAWIMQMAFQFNSPEEVYIRNKTGQNWTSWRKINDGGNADTVDGKHAEDFATTSQVASINTALNNKVDKVSGKGLSTNDFTAAYKTKLDGIATGAKANVQSDWNVTATNSDAFIKNKPTSLPANGGIADTIKNTLPIDKGGTGATDVVEVLKNLRLAHKNISEVPKSALLTYDPVSIILPIFGARTVTMLEFTNALPSDINIMCKHFNSSICGISDLPTIQGDLLIMKSYPAVAMKKVFAIFFDNENGGGLYYWMSINEKVVIDWCGLVNEKQIQDFATVAQITDINTTLNNKVDKVTGKGLSTNDFTAAYKTKLDGIANSADSNVQSDWNEKNTGSDAYIKNKPTSLPANGGNADTVDGKHAADLQNYNNLTNKPTSLPANGGNADTVDGKHASEFSVGTNKYIEFEAESNNWYRVAWSYIGRCNGVLAITLRTVVNDYNSFAVLAISLENNAKSLTTGKYYLDINVLSKNTSWEVMKKLRIVSGVIQGYGKGDYLDIFVGTKGKVILEMSFLGSMFEPLKTIEKIDTVNTEDIKKEIEL